MCGDNEQSMTSLWKIEIHIKIEENSNRFCMQCVNNTSTAKEHIQSIVDPEVGTLYPN